MARCKGCIHENVCNREVGYGYSVCPHYINSADAVPKSEADNLIEVIDNTTQQFLKLHDLYQNANREVERLEHILDCYALQYGTVTEQQEVIDKAKAEVAREIFEEIDKYVIRGISVNGDNLTLFNGKNYAELKKKFMEEKHGTN